MSDLTPFDYSALPDPSIATLLRQKADKIGAIAFRTIQDIGRELLDAKELLDQKAALDPAYKGVFMSWRRGLFPSLSDDTLEIWMNTAKLLPPLSPQELALLHTKALKLLASPTTSPRTLELTLEQLGNGQTIDGNKAFVLKHAPEPLIQRMNEGDISTKDAAAITRALQEAPTPVKTLALEEKVTKAEVVTYLRKAYERHHNSGAGQGESSWDDIRNNRALVIDDVVISLEAATAQDVDRYNEYRVWGHRQTGSRWVTLEARVPGGAEMIDGAKNLYAVMVQLSGDIRPQDLNRLYITIEVRE